MMKNRTVTKILSLVMVFLLVTASGLYAFANELNLTQTREYTLSARIGENSDAEQVEVTVSLDDNAGLNGLSFGLQYDKETFTLTEIKDNLLIGPALTFSQSFEYVPYNCSWGTKNTTSSTAIGDVITFVFTVNGIDDTKEYLFEITEPNGGYVEIGQNGPVEGIAVFEVNNCIYPVEEHSLTHYPAVEETSTTDGNIEYWYCSHCDKYFTSPDAAPESEITLEETVIPADPSLGGDDEEVLISLEITTAPDKTSYKAFESFDDTGMVVTASYSTGKTEDVTDKCSISYPSAETTFRVSDNSVYLTYGEKTVVQDVTVSKATIDTTGFGWDYTEPFVYEDLAKWVYLKNIPDGITVSYEGNSGTFAGVYTAKATLTQEDTENYELVAIDDLVWEIAPAVQTITITEADRSVKVNDTLDLEGTASSNVNGAKLVYAIKSGSSLATLNGTTLIAGSTPGTVILSVNSEAVNVDKDGAAEYNAAEEKTFSVTIDSGLEQGDSCTLTMDIVDGKEAGTIDALVNMTENGGIQAFSFKMNYDKERFELINVEDYNTIGVTSSVSQDYTVVPYMRSWYYDDPVGTTATGTLAKFTFKVVDAGDGSPAAFEFVETSATRSPIIDGNIETTYLTVNATGASYTPELPKGVSLSGQVRSYNPNNPVTINLYDSTDTQHTKVLYTTTIPAETGRDRVIQNFQIECVAAGTYDLVVSKSVHLDYVIKSIVVNDSALDLTQNANSAISTITMLAGDVDGTGSINVDDLNLVWNGKNYNKSVSASGVNQLADVDGTGSINVDDLNIVWNGANYNKGVKNCTFNYQ